MHMNVDRIKELMPHILMLSLLVGCFGFVAYMASVPTYADPGEITGTGTYEGGEWVDHAYGVKVTWLYATYDDQVKENLNNIGSIVFYAYDADGGLIGTAVSGMQKDYMSDGYIECPFSAMKGSFGGWTFTGATYPDLIDSFTVEINMKFGNSKYTITS